MKNCVLWTDFYVMDVKLQTQQTEKGVLNHSILFYLTIEVSIKNACHIKIRNTKNLFHDTFLAPKV